VYFYADGQEPSHAQDVIFSMQQGEYTASDTVTIVKGTCLCIDPVYSKIQTGESVAFNMYKKRWDGTIIFFDQAQRFDVMMVEGDEYGSLQSVENEDSGTSLHATPQGFSIKAHSTIDADSEVVVVYAWPSRSGGGGDPCSIVGKPGILTTENVLGSVKSAHRQSLSQAEIRKLQKDLLEMHRKKAKTQFSLAQKRQARAISIQSYKQSPNCDPPLATVVIKGDGCIKVTFAKTPIAIGDTTGLIFTYAESGKPIPQDKLLDVLLVSNGSSTGWLLANSTPPNTILKGALQPIKYIAPVTMTEDSILLTIHASVNKANGQDGANIGSKPSTTMNYDSTRTIKGPQGETIHPHVISHELLTAMEACPMLPPSGEVVDPHLILTILGDKSDFLITKEPAMPNDLNIEAFIENCSFAINIKYTIRLTVKWVDPFGTTWIYVFSHEAITSAPSYIWHVEWKDASNNVIFVGGDEIAVEATAIINNQEYNPCVAGPIINEFNVLGENPDPSDAYSGISDYARAVMHHESTYKQFATDTKGENQPKYPVINLNYKNGVLKSIDRGIKQINSCHEGDSHNPFGLKHIWNWKENKQKGMEILNDANNAALAWPNKIRTNKIGVQYNDEMREEVAKPGYRGCPATFDDAVEDVKNKRIWKETFRRYNGGAYAYWWWQPNNEDDPEEGGEWIKKVYSDDRDGAGDYADKVWDEY